MVTYEEVQIECGWCWKLTTSTGGKSLHWYISLEILPCRVMGQEICATSMLAFFMFKWNLKHKTTCCIDIRWLGEYGVSCEKSLCIMCVSNLTVKSCVGLKETPVSQSEISANGNSILLMGDLARQEINQRECYQYVTVMFSNTRK